MGKRLVTRTAKVLSETKRSKDKEAVAIAYEHIPRNPEEQAHGSLYAVVEIEDSGGHAEEIAEKIIDILHSEYYDNLDREPLASFESSLAKINEELAERSSEGQINWLGKLNAVLAVLSGSTLHLTQGGKAEAYLYRGEHAIHLTEDLTGDNINPLRTFINVASGEITEGDRLSFVTPGVFYKLSKNELKKYSTENSPQNAAENISQIIAGNSGSSLPNAVLFLEMVSPEIFAAQVDEDPVKETEVWIKDEQKPLENVTEQTIHGTAKFFDILGKAASNAATFVSTKAVPAIKTGAGKISAQIQGFKKEEGAERIIIDSEEKISHHEETSLEPDEIGDGILETPREDFEPEREIRIKEEHKPKRISLERFKFSGLSGAKNAFGSIGKRIRLPRGKSSIFYLIIGAVLLAGLIGFLAYSGNIKKQQVAAKNNYDQAKTKYEQAISETSSGQREQAISDLNTAKKLASDAKSAGYKASDVETLLKQISEAEDQALGIIKNTAAEIADFGKGDLDNLYSDGKYLYGISFKDGSTYRLDPTTKEVITVVEKPSLDSSIKFGTLVAKRKTIVVYTEQKSIYEIDLVAKKATKQTVSGGVEDGVAMSSYGSSIYILSPADNQIYKHISTATGYGAKTKYLTSPESNEVSSAVSIAIDSDVYVISSDGFIKKYTSGKRQNYNLNNLPENIVSPSEIIADANVSGQYIIAEKNRIIKIDENQSFVAQYASDAISDIKGVFVNDTAQTIYALSGGKVYTIKF
jgi:hypothetical protein